MDFGFGRIIKLIFIDSFALGLVLLRISCPGTMPPPPELTVSTATVEIEPDTSITVTASSTDPEDEFTWESDRIDIATAVDGLILGVAEGSALATVRGTNSGLTQTVAVTVFPRIQAPNVFPLASFTNETTVQVSGTGTKNTTIEISGGANAITALVDANGDFSVEVPLKLNRLNRLFLTGVGQSGKRSAPTTAELIQDEQPPNVFIDIPAAGSEVFDAMVDVAGRVGDLLSGVNGLQVDVNGVAAEVDIGSGTNGTFLATSVPLVLGANTITATASDQLGNTATAFISVIRSELTGPRISVLSGNDQSAQTNSELGQPVIVQVLDESNMPVANCLLTWNVTRSEGRLAATSGAMSEEMSFETTTDAQGQSQLIWTVGSDAGCGNNCLQVTAACTLNTAFVCASASAGPPSQINIGSGNNQRAEVNNATAEPLNVLVSDGLNGIPNIPVTFEIDTGTGTFGGQKMLAMAMTDATGHAEVDFELGVFDGPNTVKANFPGNPGGPAVFTINGLYRIPGESTSFVGRVVVFDDAA